MADQAGVQDESEFNIVVEPLRADRMRVTIERGRYLSAFDLSRPEAELMIERINRYGVEGNHPLVGTRLA